MQIAFHIGAIATDGERLLKSLLKKAGTLAARGIRVPGPGKDRELLRETMRNRTGGPPATGTHDFLLGRILSGAEAERLVIRRNSFPPGPDQLFDGGTFYGDAAAKVRSLATLFPQDAVEFRIGIRNPATCLPAVLERSAFSDMPGFLRGADPRSARWSEVIARLLAAVPEARVSVWCTEDTPPIWGMLIRGRAGFEEQAPVIGGHDLLAENMSEDEMRRLQSDLPTQPPETTDQERCTVATFLEPLALLEEVVEEPDVPRWTTELVEDLSAASEAASEVIAARPRVTFVAL